MNINLPKGLKELPPDYSGEIFISDIDKTYLKTDIDSFWGLLKTAIQQPETKENIPGFSILLRALRRGVGDEPASKPLFFISASPPQISDKILTKFAMDGVKHEGIIFKDQLQHVKNRDFKKLREQISYKLLALLRLWRVLPYGATLYLFGDDSESDAVIYNLFYEVVCEDKYSKGEFYEVLCSLGVDDEDAILVSEEMLSIPRKRDLVDGIFINLISGTQVNFYRSISKNIVATSNTLQLTLFFWSKNLIRDRAVHSIARALVVEGDYNADQLLASLERFYEQGSIDKTIIEKFCKLTSDIGFHYQNFETLKMTDKIRKLPLINKFFR